MDEVIYQGLTPHESVQYFRFGVRLGFYSTRSYQWVNGRQHYWQLPEKRFSDAWQRKIWEEVKTASFRLPCIPSLNHTTRQEHVLHFITYRKRGRKVKGWVCHYRRDDAIFNQFINRFNDEGNLAIGRERYWSQAENNLFVSGIEWALPNFKTGNIPRKSKIASQPKDNTNYVYLIRMGRTKFYKIGKSNDPQGRLASMQTASPYKLKLAHTFKADNAAAAEETLHHKLREFRQAGEWFKLSDEQYKTIVAVVAYENGRFITKTQTYSIEELLV